MVEYNFGKVEQSHFLQSKLLTFLCEDEDQQDTRDKEDEDESHFTEPELVPCTDFYKLKYLESKKN